VVIVVVDVDVGGTIPPVGAVVVGAVTVGAVVVGVVAVGVVVVPASVLAGGDDDVVGVSLTCGTNGFFAWNIENETSWPPSTGPGGTSEFTSWPFAPMPLAVDEPETFGRLTDVPGPALGPGS
jgi:hypothetical protein